RVHTPLRHPVRIRHPHPPRCGGPEPRHPAVVTVGARSVPGRRSARGRGGGWRPMTSAWRHAQGKRGGAVTRGFRRERRRDPCRRGGARRRRAGRGEPMKTVRAAVVNAVREPIRVELLTLRAPRADEVLVRLGASGVCHSDLHVINGDLPMPLPTVLGHEGAGVVDAVINTARVGAGQSVAVFGAGGVGLNVVQGAALVGAHPIIAVDLNDRKLDLAREFGATHVVNGGSADPVGAIQELTGGRGVDVSFEVIGRPEVIVQAFLALRRGGKAAVVGVAPAAATVSLPGFLLPLAEKSLVGSLYGSADMARDVPRLLALYRAGKLKLDELVTRRISEEHTSELQSRFDLVCSLLLEKIT